MKTWMYVASVLFPACIFAGWVPPEEMQGEFVCGWDGFSTQSRRMVEMRVGVDGTVTLRSHKGDAEDIGPFSMAKMDTEKGTYYLVEGTSSEMGYVGIAFRFDPQERQYHIVGEKNSPNAEMDLSSLENEEEMRGRDEARKRLYTTFRPKVNASFSEEQLRVRIAGVYDNLESDFGGAMVTFSTNGFALVSFSFAPVVSPWTILYMENEPYVSLQAKEFFSSNKGKDVSFLFKVNATQETLLMCSVSDEEKSALELWPDRKAKMNWENVDSTLVFYKISSRVTLGVEEKIARYPEVLKERGL